MPVHEPEWKDACGVIGEVVLLYSALDHQLNFIVMAVMHLSPSPMLETVVATLDTRQKIELLKSRAGHIKQKDWQNALKTHVDRLERVSRIRNGACHTPLVSNKASGKLEFAPIAASKILKSLKVQDTKSYSFERVTIDRVREIIPVAERALGSGEELLSNFAKVRAALEQKKAVTRS